MAFQRWPEKKACKRCQGVQTLFYHDQRVLQACFSDKACGMCGFSNHWASGTSMLRGSIGDCGAEAMAPQSDLPNVY